MHMVPGTLHLCAVVKVGSAASNSSEPLLSSTTPVRCGYKNIIDVSKCMQPILSAPSMSILHCSTTAAVRCQGSHLYFKQGKAQCHIQEQADDGKACKGAKHPKCEDRWQCHKEPTLLNGQATVKDDGGKQVSVAEQKRICIDFLMWKKVVVAGQLAEPDPIHSKCLSADQSGNRPTLIQGRVPGANTASSHQEMSRYYCCTMV